MDEALPHPLSTVPWPPSTVPCPPTTSHHPPSTPPAVVDSLAAARQLADSGQLADALACCREDLGRSGPSADLYSLMGVIQQAMQERDEAIRCFQRALYLKPTHAEAMAHLLLLCQEQGDDDQAQRLRQRLERVVPGGEP